MRTSLFLVLLASFACQKGTPNNDVSESPAEVVEKSTPESKPLAPPAAVTPLVPGTRVPAITAVAHDGTKVDFASYIGKPFVVYFYPKDDTPG